MLLELFYLRLSKWWQMMAKTQHDPMLKSRQLIICKMDELRKGGQAVSEKLSPLCFLLKRKPLA